MNNIHIWDFSIPRNWLTQYEFEYLVKMPKNRPTLEWVWGEMNRVWYEHKLDNKYDINKQSISDYYAHPLWLMNGIFTSLDPVSISHRTAIAMYLKRSKLTSIADYGGGFGELAFAITEAIPESSLSIVEPYPSKVGIERLSSKPRIKIIPNLESEYGVVIAQDVLEHIENPILLAFQMAHSVQMGGKLIFANCFYPVIECHLPATFHLRHTFPIVMWAMGLRYVGRIEAAEHAQVFKRTGQIDLHRAQYAERLSKIVGPLINKLFGVVRSLKRFLLYR